MLKKDLLVSKDFLLNFRLLIANSFPSEGRISSYLFISDAHGGFWISSYGAEQNTCGLPRYSRSVDEHAGSLTDSDVAESRLPMDSSSETM